MYKPIRASTSSVSKMQALRASFRAISAPPACVTSVARVSTTASARADGDLVQSDVVKQVADKLNYDPTDVGIVLNEALAIISETVTNGNKVAFKGMCEFGSQSLSGLLRHTSALRDPRGPSMTLASMLSGHAGFGTFKRTETSARKGRNPQTGAELSLPASARPAFTAAKPFKENVKEKYQSSKK